MAHRHMTTIQAPAEEPHGIGPIGWLMLLGIAAAAWLGLEHNVTGRDDDFSDYARRPTSSRRRRKSTKRTRRR